MNECRQATGGFKGSNREGLVFSVQETKFILGQTVTAMQGVHGMHTACTRCMVT